MNEVITATNGQPYWNFAPAFRAPYQTPKGKVMVAPFPDMTVKTGRSGGTVGVGRVENDTTMVLLDVLAGSEDNRFVAGQKVLVLAKLYGQPWAKAIQTLKLCGVETKFIIIPDNVVEAIFEASSLPPKEP